MGRLPQPPGDALVRRVNRIFHEEEAGYYACRHREMHGAEQDRWERVIRESIERRASSAAVLDVGCGTGFVSSLLAERLGQHDQLLCLDISEAMARLASETATETSSGDRRPRISAVVSTAEHIPLPSDSASLVTANSVLHHLPKPQAFVEEARRVLRPGGLLIIGHEPSRSFYASRLRRALLMLLVAACHPVRVVSSLGLLPLGGDDREIQLRVNRRLMDEGIVEKPLTRVELISIVDIHSPMGGLHPDRGFDLATFGGGEGMLEGFSVVSIETYGVLERLSSERPLGIGVLEWLVARLLGAEGAYFMVLAEKRTTAGGSAMR